MCVFYSISGLEATPSCASDTVSSDKGATAMVNNAAAKLARRRNLEEQRMREEENRRRILAEKMKKEDEEHLAFMDEKNRQLKLFKLLQEKINEEYEREKKKEQQKRIQDAENERKK